jgi:hypothetical protein
VIKINNRLAVVLAAVLIIISAIGLMMYPNQSQGLQFSSSVMPDGSITIQGHVLPDGDLALFYFSSPTGPNIIHSTTVVPVNQISLDLYSLQAQNLTITVVQFSGFYTHNVTTRIGNNTTITTPVKSMIEPEYDNTTIKTQFRELETFTITLPQTSIQRDVSITIDNETFYFLHKTSPDIFPVFLTGLGQLGIALGYLFMGVIIFFLGTLTADLLLKRMKYWPPFGKLGWTMILFILGLSMGMIIFSDYYQLAYVQWYYWLVPFYIFSTLAMLEIWPQKFEKWHIIQIDPQRTETNGVFETVYVSPRKNDDQAEYLQKSRKHAFARLLGRHIPITFDRGDRDLWHLKISGTEERIYFTTRWPYFTSEEQKVHSLRKGREKTRKKTTGYRIPVHGDYMKEVIEMILKLRSVISISKENQDLKDELLDLKVFIQNGTVRANMEKVDQITEKLFNKKFMPRSRIAGDTETEGKKSEGDGT